MNDKTKLLNNNKDQESSKAFYFIKKTKSQDIEDKKVTSYQNDHGVELPEMIPSNSTKSSTSSNSVSSLFANVVYFNFVNSILVDAFSWISSLFRKRQHEYQSIAEIKPRKIPIKVEPKVFFANERTFLAWLHMSVTLASISIAIVS